MASRFRTEKRLTFVATLFASVLGAHSVRAADPVCKDSYVSAQQLRNHGKLVEARGAVVACATATCDDFIHTDCIRWLAEIDTALPTVVVEVTTPADEDVATARITVDGAPFDIDGLAHPLDPGPHAFHVEAPGMAAIDRDIVVHEGEKDRRLRFEMIGSAAAKKVEPSHAPTSRTETRRPVPLLTWILGGTGIVAGGVGAVVVIDDIARANSYNSGCPASGGTAAQCPGDAVSDVHRREFIGYGLVAAGAVLEASALTIYFLRPTTTVTIGVRSTPTQIGVFGFF